MEGAEELFSVKQTEGGPCRKGSGVREEVGNRAQDSLLTSGSPEIGSSSWACSPHVFVSGWVCSISLDCILEESRCINACGSGRLSSSLPPPSPPLTLALYNQLRSLDHRNASRAWYSMGAEGKNLGSDDVGG